MKKSLIIILLLLTEFAMTAQNSKDTVVHIGEVKITDTPITKKDEMLAICFEPVRIDSGIMKQNCINSLSDLLSENTHIFIKSYGQGSLSVASFRGTGASHTQVLWNGISLNNPMLGQVDFSLIPVFFFDEIRINAGGNSLQSVSGALGGSIELNSVPNTAEKYTASLIQTFGNFNTYQSFFKAGVGFQKFQTVFKVYHEQSQNNFRFYNTATGLQNYEKQKNADYVKNALLNESRYKISRKQYFTLTSWFQTNNRNIPPIMSYQGSERNENQSDNELRILAKYHIKQKNSNSEITAAIIQEHLNYFLADNTETQQFIHTDSKSKTTLFFSDYSFEYEPFKKLFLKSNISYKHQKAYYFETETQSGYNANRDIAELYLSVRYKLSDYLITHTFLRAGLTDFKLIPIMPSIGFEFHALKNLPLIIKINFSKNYHQPTLNDLRWIPGGNPDLKPEQGYSSDLSSDYSVKNNNYTFKMNITEFASYISDWIIWQPEEFGYWKASNIRKVFSRGIESSLTGTYHNTNFKMSVFTNYSYTKTTNESPLNNTDISTGKQLIYTPVHKANALVTFDYLPYFIRLSYNYTGKRFTTSSNEELRHSLPAFSVFNIETGRKFNLKNIKFEAQLKVKNVLNTNYQEILWRAMPGRYYIFVLKLNL